MGEIATVNSVEHAVRLVELMASSENVLGVSQMAQSLGLPRATIYRLLKTLAQREWVVQDDKTYRLSFRLAGLFRGAGATAAAAALAERGKRLTLPRSTATASSTLRRSIPPILSACFRRSAGAGRYMQPVSAKFCWLRQKRNCLRECATRG